MKKKSRMSPYCKDDKLCMMMC